MKFEFAMIPPVGLALLIDGRRFDLVGIEGHIRRDGEATKLLVWYGECATCGVGFTAKSPSNRPCEARRCEIHRQPGKRIEKAAR